MRIVLFFWCTIASIAVFAQQRNLTGTITDEKGKMLPGVTVTVKGTKIMTLSNGEGAFSIYVPEAAQTLVFTFVGMDTKEATITGLNSLAVSMKATTAEGLDEVVVIGYGTAKRANVSSSISSVKAADIRNLPLAGIDQALQGKVAGVNVSTNGGQPGGGISVRVRGITSVNGNEPLYVIDGVPILTPSNSTSQDQLGGRAGQTQQSPLASINTNDIETIDILKDASAQAIYGSLAANGVVIITTKRGKSPQGKLNYDMYVGVSALPRFLDVMDLRDYARYYNSLVPEIRAAGSGADTIPELKNPNVLGPGTDWQRELYRTGFQQSHQLSFSGAQNKTSYFFSGNYFSQEGTIIGSDFKRYSLRANIDQQMNTWLRAGISTNLTRSKQNIALSDGTETPTNIVLFNSPASPVRDLEGNFLTNTTLGSNVFGNNINPIAVASLRDVGRTQSKAFGSIYVELMPVKNLSIRGEANYDFQLQESHAFQPLVLNESTQQTILAPSRLREDRGTSMFWMLKQYATYSPSIGNHHISVTAGHESWESNFNQVYNTATNLNLNIPSLGAGTIDPASSGGGRYASAMESYFARANYTYSNRYTIAGSIRRDASSNFGPNKRIGYFPAVSAGWTLSNEAFAQNWTSISNLKLRLGYGSVGNQNSPVGNAFSTNIRLFPISPFGPGGVPANVGNPSLSWESVYTYNAGLDFSLLKNRIDVTIDAYRKVTRDMILATVLPAFAGLDPNPPNNAYRDIVPPITNAGEMRNTGIDIAITSYNIVQKDFSWKTTTIFSHYKNLLVSLNSDAAVLRGADQDFSPGSFVNLTFPGNAIGTFFGFKTNGIFRTMNDLNNNPRPLPIGPQQTWLGDIMFRDLSGPDGKPDGIIGSEDVMVIGDPNPDFTFGMTNTFNYKGFELTMFIQGVYGSEIYNWTRKYTESMSNAFNNQLSTVFNRWTPENVNATMPRYNQWNGSNLRTSDRYVEDGSYLRMQNVTLGYNLPLNTVKKMKMSSARVYASAQNLFTLTSYNGYDPEIGAYNQSVLTQNVDNGRYPNPRTFVVGFNLEF